MAVREPEIGLPWSTDIGRKSPLEAIYETLSKLDFAHQQPYVRQVDSRPTPTRGQAFRGHDNDADCTLIASYALLRNDRSFV